MKGTETGTGMGGMCDTDRKKCRIELVLEHDPVERATYAVWISAAIYVGGAVVGTGSDSISFG